MTELPTTGFLGRLDPADARVVLGAGRVRRVRAGATLVHEGDDATSVLFLLSGRVKVSIAAPSGREVVLDVLGPGDIVGELSAIDGLPRSASATALADSEVCAVAFSAFHALVTARPSLAQALLMSVTARLRAASRRQLELAGSDALARVCGRLAELAGDSGQMVTVPMSQGDLASWAGLSREAVVKALRTLRDLGWIELEGRDLVLLEPEQIKERAAPL